MSNSDYKLLDKEDKKENSNDKSTQTNNNTITTIYEYDNNECCSNTEFINCVFCCFITLFLCK
jgi:hypothetical protein